MKKSRLLYFLFVFGTAVLISLSGIFTISMAQAEPDQLNFYSQSPPKMGRFIYCYAPWFASIEKMTNGRVKINALPFQAKAPPLAGYDKILNGDAALSVLGVASLPKQFPLCQILGLPGIGFKDTKMASYVVWSTYKEIPEIQKEFDQFQVLLGHAYAPMVVATKGKPIRVPSDLSGLKTWVGPSTKAILEAAGGIYLDIPLFQTGTLIEAGKIDACIIGWPGQIGFGLLKSAKYFTELPMLGCRGFFIAMNKAKWNALAADVQQAIMHESGDKASRLFGEAEVGASLEAKEFINSQADKELIVLTPEEEAQWFELVAPSNERMIAASEAKGLPAQKVFDKMVHLANQYKP